MLAQRKNRSLSTAAQALWEVVREEGNTLTAAERRSAVSAVRSVVALRNNRKVRGRAGGSPQDMSRFARLEPAQLSMVLRNEKTPEGAFSEYGGSCRISLVSS
jgi:hypothetical protein